MNEDILARLNQLEERLHRLERRIFPTPAAAEPPPPRREAPAPLPPFAAPSTPLPEPSENSASRILGFVAVLCFVGAATFLIKLAITSGWLTPERQIALAGLFGVALVATGLILRRRDAEYLGMLSAAGVIILDLAAIGGHVFYDLYVAEVSVAAVACISVISIYCYSVFRNELYALIAVLGAYSSLFLLVATVEPVTLTTYYLVWDIAFAIVALSFRSRIIILLAAYMGLGGYHFKAVGFALPGTEVLWLVVGVQAIQFVLFTVSSVIFSVKHRRPFSEAEAWAYFPLLLFFYGIEYFLINSHNPDLAPWMAVAFAGFLYAVYFTAKGRLAGQQLHSTSIVATFGSLVLLHAVYFNLLSSRAQLWVGPPVLLLTPWLWKKLNLSAAHRSYSLVAVIIGYFSLFRVVFHSQYSWELVGLNVAFLVVFWVLYLGNKAKKGPTGAVENEALGLLLLVLANGQFMLASYRALVLMSEASQAVESFRPFWISSVWGIFGLACLLAARARKDVLVAKAALTLLVVTTLKVFLFDVASSSPLIRISCLMIMGLVLYAGGYVLRTVKSWEQK